ncbi:hypothetical protein CRE_13930 [Caenorhabditis remanei]|uniref:C-type lectin domain-containing protein n=1 Tax=Caenorhabditis remanei TaxID=31234 RepID=E3M8T4_CAERE|nr:hypothetical protein CRE_13930 [Caenorhabditis remanei]
MNPSFLLFFSLIGITVSIIVGGGGGGRGHFDDDSRHYSGGRDSSDSSDSHEHHPHPHRPPRPHKPHPPRELTKCPDNWILFKRPQGNWCVNVFTNVQTWQSAEDICKLYGAVLTGLQTNEERLKLAEKARLITAPLIDHSYVWLGAKRKPECPRLGVCPKPDTFYWTDGATTGTEGFGWVSTQPDGQVYGAYGVQACAAMLVYSSGYNTGGTNQNIHGQLDDAYCQTQPKPVTLAACGKKAT